MRWESSAQAGQLGVWETRAELGVRVGRPRAS